MIVWGLAGVITLAVLIALVRSLLRAGTTLTERQAYDATVYRAQLQELETDAARGLIGGDELESARREIARRLLATETATGPSGGSDRKEHGWRRAAVLIVVLAIPLAGAGIYGWRGNPALPGQPAGTGAQRAVPADATDMRQSIARLEARLRDQPDDVDGWVLLGRSFMITAEPHRAIEAFRRAIEIAPGDERLRSFYGESLVMAADGVVTPQAREAFDRALKSDPSDPAARFYLALSDAQAGRWREALDRWSALAFDTPEEAPWRGMLVSQIESAARELAIDPRSLAALRSPTRGPERPRGPTAEDMQAAQSLSTEDRNAMIRSMVEGLAARLRQNPNDIEGWQRLIRSYQVLGEGQKAREAQARLEALQRGSPSPTESRPSAPPPSPVGNEATAHAATDQQNAMVQSMVATLAQRLASNADDRDGWLRLGRSYQVLGRSTDSLAAYARAAELWPNDAEVLQAGARANLETAPTGANVPTAALNLYRRLLEHQPNHVEALYYVGLGESQRDNPAEAERLWRRLLGHVASGSEIEMLVQSRLTALRRP
ncbi:MAG: c-type cytochrome biogenesis protein CcmI [Alphaproteobacteria bacterium]|nr:c-type cytochrome biogenesis protein CcmI [Alphaproteobacteria bacterium]